MLDSLYDARNYLVVGNFKQAVSEANTARPTTRQRDELEDFQANKSLILAQAHIGLHQEETAQQLSLLNSHTPMEHPLVAAVQAWCSFLLSAKRSPLGFSTEDAAVSEALKALETEANEVDLAKTQFAIFAVSGLIAVRRFADALMMANVWILQLKENTTENASRALMRRMELHYLVVEALLRMNRTDQAKKEVTIMEEADDESVFTNMAQGLVALYIGQAKNDADSYNQAASEFSSASVRFGETEILFNLGALAKMGCNNVNEASRTIHNALDMGNDNISTANSAMIMMHQGKYELSEELETMVKMSPKTGWIGSYVEMENRLDDAIEKFTS